MVALTMWLPVSLFITYHHFRGVLYVSKHSEGDIATGVLSGINNIRLAGNLYPLSLNSSSTCSALPAIHGRSVSQKTSSVKWLPSESTFLSRDNGVEMACPWSFSARISSNTSKPLTFFSAKSVNPTLSLSQCSCVFGSSTNGPISFLSAISRGAWVAWPAHGLRLSHVSKHVSTV